MIQGAPPALQLIWMATFDVMERMPLPLLRVFVCMTWHGMPI